MGSSPAKENILKKIRQALMNPVPLPFPESEGTGSLFHPPTQDETIVFAEEFTRLQGKFAFCSDIRDLRNQLTLLCEQKNWTRIYCADHGIKELIRLDSAYPHLDDCDVSITGCEYLVARTGTMVLSSVQPEGRTASVYAPIHICIAFSRQMVYDLKDALNFLKIKYAANFPSLITFATGPSRTADIEKTLVTGVHGPKEVYCFLVEDSPVL